MKFSRTGLPNGLALGVSGVLALGLTLPASADTYHAVTSGETLSAIAKRYNVKTNDLREANKLSNLGDNSPLAAMLLRIPGAEEIAANSASAQSSTPAPRAATTLRQQVPSQSAARYFGTVTRTTPYVVQNGDTLESVAARFTQHNESVSVAEIRSRNHLSTMPRVGTTIQIPIKTTYGVSQSSAQIQPRAAARAITPDSGDSASISVVNTSSGDEPVARVITADAAPVYQAPNASRGQLASRGGYGSMIEGGRVLQNGEELMSAPSKRTNTRSSSLPATHNLARVAKISQNGARIRRLPDADAATLYNCKTGTEIAVIRQQGAWSAILMSDRSTGWIPTRYLNFTGASVDITSQVETQDRGDDTATGWTAGYQSNHPAIRYALSWLGTPYVYGGNSTRGIDCSALMQRAFAASGKKLPRVSRDQAKVGMKVSPENLQPGDRLYFSASGTHVDHTGLYMGNGLYVHASGGARKVVVSRLREPRSWNIFVGARR